MRGRTGTWSGAGCGAGRRGRITPHRSIDGAKVALLVLTSRRRPRYFLLSEYSNVSAHSNDGEF
jgi:hypothetical protein